MIVRLRTAVLAALLLLLSTVVGPAPAVAGATRQVGPGPGDADDSTSTAYCPLNTVLVGLNVTGRSSSGLSTISGLCEGYDGSGRLNGQRVKADGYLGDKYGPGLDSAAEADCPSGSAIVGLIASWTGDAHRILGLKILCRPTVRPKDDTEVVAFYTWDKQDSTGTCPYGTGVSAAQAKWLDETYIVLLALVCDPLRLRPDQPPLKIDNGKDDDGGEGGGGATAATDTTIYDQADGNEIAYLSAGDPVAIVECNNDNWCEIGRPRHGWVWGDDLNR